MYLLLIIIGIIGLIGIIIIVSRKISSLILIDVEKTVPKTKKVKEEIIASRFKRILKEKGEGPKNLFKNVSGKFKIFFEGAIDKLMEIEAKAKSLEKKKAGKLPQPKQTPKKIDEKNEKIEGLLREAASLAKGGDDWKRAEGKYIEIIKLDSKNIPAYEGLGQLYMDNHKVDEARQIFEFLLKLGRETPDLYTNIANLAWDEDNLDEAKIYYLKALSLDGSRVIARVNLGMIFSKLGDKEAAAQQFRAALELEPKNPRYLDLLIESSVQIGNEELARQALRNLMQVNPENKKIDDFKKKINAM